MARLAARHTDAVRTGHPCTSTTQLDTPKQDKVFIEGKLAARKTDLTVSHTQKTGTDFFGNDICTPHTAPITGSSNSVYIAGKLAARKTDACDDGEITGSASKTYIG